MEVTFSECSGTQKGTSTMKHIQMTLGDSGHQPSPSQYQLQMRERCAVVVFVVIFIVVIQ